MGSSRRRPFGHLGWPIEEDDTVAQRKQDEPYRDGQSEACCADDNEAPALSGQGLLLQTKLPDEFIDACRRLRLASQLGTCVYDSRLGLLVFTQYDVRPNQLQPSLKVMAVLR